MPEPEAEVVAAAAAVLDPFPSGGCNGQHRDRGDGHVRCGNVAHESIAHGRGGSGIRRCSKCRLHSLSVCLGPGLAVNNCRVRYIPNGR